MVVKLGDKLKKAYSLIHNDKLDEAKKAFEEIYNIVEEDELVEGSDIFNNYISCLLGLGEIYMKKRNLEKSLEYYKIGYDLTNGKEFNILFNMGVVYQNLGKVEESEEMLKKAKEINPNDPNLIRFLGEIGGNDMGDGNQQVDKDFEKKVEEMINSLK